VECGNDELPLFFAAASSCRFSFQATRGRSSTLRRWKAAT